jgi:hypothetical protein
MLKQIGLIYFVNDGLMVITSAESENLARSPSISKPSPLVELTERARRGELDEEEMASFLAQLESIDKMEALLQRVGSEHHGAADPKVSAMTSEQAKALIVQMKELTDALKVPQARPRGDHSQ